jgi:hypothetical protein
VLSFAQMNVKGVIKAFLVLVIVIAAVIWLGKRYKSSKISLPTATPSVLEKIEGKFPNIIIPKDSEKIELKDVSGGSSMGIATKNEVIADLPEPAPGQTYQGWIGNDTKKVLLGSLKLVKGGWVLEYNSAKYPGYNKISVTLGSKTILEGSF